MNADTVRKMLRDAQGSASLRVFAAQWRMDHTYLYRIMVGEREPSDEVLMHLGLERVVTYRKTNNKRLRP